MVLPNGLCVGKESIADPVDICRCTPRVNTFCASNLMRRRTVPPVCAYEYRRVDFAPEVLQESGEQKDCARHVMRELAQKQPRFSTVDEHQFREREVWRQPDFMCFLPTANFIEETRQTMNGTVKISFGFGRSQ